MKMRKSLISTFAAATLLLSAGYGSAQEGRGARDPNATPPVQGQNVNGMHIYIRSGLKSHGEGAHDYPQFLADWSKVLTDHGAVVDGSFHAPSAAELAHTDVLVIYKGDAGYMTPEEKATLEAYVKRGGGIVSIHDSLCGPDPVYFSSLVGGAKKHTERNSAAGPLTYTVTDTSSPITKGLANFSFNDEAFYAMTWAKNPEIHVLATVAIPAGRAPAPGQGPNGQAVGTPSHAGEIIPQIWTYEHTLPGGQPARAFVYMQGHAYENFANPVIQNMLLRGISWAAKHPVEELASYQPPADQAGRGGRGQAGQGGRGPQAN
jgi:type 1 glutamine amidotransferase